MTAKSIDGKAFAQKIIEALRVEVAKFHAQSGVKPALAVILVGEDAASQVYVRNKGKKAVEAGFESLEFRLDAEISEQALLDQISALNNDEAVHGILVQLPLPEHIDSDKVLNHIAPEKDVDGFHPVNIGRLWSGNPVSIPCTPLGCSLILKDYFGDLSGKQAVVVGRSNIVGKPMAALLLQMNATVCIAHSKTADLPALLAQADIVVAAVGQANFIRGEWLKADAVVLDVGINRITDENGQTKLVGDVDFISAREKVAAITPVPGGIGPMTIACLLKNTLACARKIQGL